MTKDEILTRLIKDGHITLEELRVLDTQSSSINPIPVVIPYQEPDQWVNPYRYEPPYRVTCSTDTPGVGDTTFNVKVDSGYFVGMDPIQSNIDKAEVHVFRKEWRQVPSGFNIDKILLIKPKPNES